VFLSLWLSVPTWAAVIAADASSFTVQHEVLLPVPADQAYARALRVSRWWSADHSYGGDAERFSLKAKPGGCWCERLPGGGFVEHMRVAAALPGELLRLLGALGPLQELGASAAWTWTFTPEAGGTRVAWTYAVRGAGGDELAAAVDGVLGEAIGRYAAAE
jgi:uncharacterized protein YndB with AHSA1/START domain